MKKQQKGEWGMEILNEIFETLSKYDRYLQNELREPTDKNVALYEHWIDCAYDVEEKLKEMKKKLVEENYSTTHLAGLCR